MNEHQQQDISENSLVLKSFSEILLKSPRSFVMKCVNNCNYASHCLFMQAKKDLEVLVTQSLLVSESGPLFDVIVDNAYKLCYLITHLMRS